MAETEKEGKIELIPIEQLKPLPIHFTVIGKEEEDMLREDMKTKDLNSIDPILARKMTPEEIAEAKEKYPLAKYEIIDGHTRWEIAKLLKWTEMRVIIIECSRDEAYIINYKRNKERGFVDPMLEAVCFNHFYQKGYTASQVADMFHVKETTVWNTLQRLKVGKEARRKIIQQAFMGKPITAKHIEVVATLPEEKQPKLVETITEKGLSAKEARKVAKALVTKPEAAERILELPKPKLVEEAEKIVTPPLKPKTPEEVAYERIMELKEHYPMILIDYIYTRYKGKYLKDVIKASIFIVFWEKLTEEQREEVAQKAIKMAGERGFEQPIVG
ncbi:MAG: ParB N-terminal domain-containing protein [Candidatus Bathyarchaeia archaeon]